MSTLGTLGYYADSHIPHEDDDHMAPRFATGPSLPQPRELTLSEYGEQESYPFQAKSAIFGASWSPVPVQPPGSTPIAYHSYIHHPCPTGEPDGASMRSWALEPLSASVPFTGLSTDMHHDIKLEPLVGNGECTTLHAHTLIAPDAENDTGPAAKKVSGDADLTHPKDDKTSTETKPDLDPNHSEPEPGQPPSPQPAQAEPKCLMPAACRILTAGIPLDEGEKSFQEKPDLNSSNYRPRSTVLLTSRFAGDL
ncbi:homeobox protein Hox-A9b isoform X2 [Brachyhypopomus gauderio]|uniref:homeobox protein Hox-A9b isoform X2 n=1 Tax=Brachyhypopomus gauderio TaxID=698409 RepID=UPI004042398A